MTPSSTGPPPYVPGHGLLAGKRVLVTAAAGTGIGFATAKRAAEEGATVVISDKHERRLHESAAELDALGVPCDVTDEASVASLFAAATQDGPIDVLSYTPDVLIFREALGLVEGEIPVALLVDAIILAEQPMTG